MQYPDIFFKRRDWLCVKPLFSVYQVCLWLFVTALLSLSSIAFAANCNTSQCADLGVMNSKIANFKGGIAVSGGAFQKEAKMTLLNTVEVFANISVDPAHVGQTADILVFAEYLVDENTTLLFMLDKDLNVIPYKKGDYIVPFRTVKLGSQQDILMYSGHFIATGKLLISVAYRLQDGTIVENVEYIVADIKEKTVTAQASVLTSSVWSDPNINVCWENPTSSNEYYRNIVKSAVLDTWDKVSAVNFIGWGQCLSNSRGIRIVFKDEPGNWLNHWPHTKTLGYWLDGRPEGMLLNHEFNNWPEGSGCKSMVDYCVRSIAVHEFGHALGFAHEQARKDTPSWCTQRQQGGETDGDWYSPNWDINSIMNYCNPKNNNEGKLSADDIAAVQKIYGLPNTQCTYSVSATQTNVTSTGQSGLSATVNTQSTCSWTASSSVSWITLSNASGQGNGQINYSVVPNTNTSSRTGVINVGGQSITITQAGVTPVACSYTVSPTQASNIAATGQSGLSIAINAQSSCTWMASTNVNWITLNNTTGQGNGQINYSVASNTSTSPRTGVINVGGQSVSVTQIGATNSFNASLTNVKYEYNTPACQSAEFPVFVLLSFATQGVNQSDLMYVQNQPTVYEEKVSVGSQGLSRGFCSIPSWKTTLSFQFREISTGKLSNIMTTPIDTTIPASTGTFNASLKNITYTYNPSSCSAQFPVVVQMFFETTGVSQSNLIYVESQPSVSESNVSLTSQGLVRSFCSTNGWKTPLSFRLKDSSTGKFSNTMTAALDTTVSVSTTPLSINISGQLNNVTLLPATGASDSGNQTISGMSQNRTFYLASGQKASILVSGQINKIYISNRIAGNVSYSSSGQANEVFRVD